MIPIPTITFTLPPLTWTGFCAGTMLGTMVTLALGLYWAPKKPKGSGGIPFEKIEDLGTKKGKPN